MFPFNLYSPLFFVVAAFLLIFISLVVVVCLFVSTILSPVGMSTSGAAFSAVWNDRAPYQVQVYLNVGENRLKFDVNGFQQMFHSGDRRS